MLSIFWFAIQFLVLLRTISASPLPHHQNHAKRSVSGQNVGSGFAIAICVLFLATTFYYLGTRHERTKAWFIKRNAPAQPEHSSGSGVVSEAQRHRRQISCPLAVSSSAPIKPYDDPIEVPTPSLRYYEMPVEEIYEMGPPSPIKPPSRARLSLDRKPWWLKHSEDQEQGRSEGAIRSKSIHSWFKSVRGSSNIEAIASPLDITHSCSAETCRAVLDNMERASGGSSLLDWSGLDHIRGKYFRALGDAFVSRHRPSAALHQEAGFYIKTSEDHVTPPSKPNAPLNLVSLDQ
ncbi:uncharacterized protein M421DRAFT_90146 [Didymella exigua CBS 183.55]|uniref:Uncharacterized protein n=1 Tax=Didymella exigua CBS 183.55 TaxID=1150837 RepID=A0A6A5RWI5_9PLEO|nr:uncharacterized protein M421DRAFT_90146 [Didymella exigua CBS 183.55]KAF1931953.1 hypothetical protein M421DRAFT_90146 [Didymella exigua CBS 183.55]